MLPHFIVRPTAQAASPEGLHFTYDFDRKTTSIARVVLEGSDLVTSPATEVEGLLRHPAPVADGWLAATMPVREFGQPAHVERWSWDPVARVEQRRVPHEKVGLMKMATSADGSHVLLDRAFRESGVLNDALVLRWPPAEGSVLELRSTVHPIISGLVTATFDAANERLALIHVDQGVSEAQLYRLDGPEASLVGAFAHDQLPTDFHTGAVAFVDDTLVVWVLDVAMLTSSLGVYDANGSPPTFAPLTSFVVDVDEEPDSDAYEMILSNCDPAFAIRDGAAWIGGQGFVHRVPLDGSDPTERAVPLDVVVQIHSFGDRLLAVDTANALALVDA